MTTLKKISGPYTSINVGAYQPVFLRWLSAHGVQGFASHLSARALVLNSHAAPTAIETAQITTASLLDPWSEALAYFTSDPATPPRDPDDLSSVRTPDLARSILRSLVSKLSSWSAAGVVSEEPFRLAGQSRTSALQLDTKNSAKRDLHDPVFWPGVSLAESLSPIGLLHLYGHYYFNNEEGVGPIEQALTLGPRESVEVVLQTTRRTTIEEQRESTEESETQKSSEDKSSEELSDRVSSMIEKSKSTTVSVSAGGSVGVFEAKGSVSTTSSQTSRNTREQSTRSVKDLTTRASERLKKSFSIRTRSLQEFSATNTTRRMINNPDDKPVNYALRRVFRRMNVRVQDIGPRMVWQFYVRDPGARLGQPIFLDHRQVEEPIFSVERPQPGEDEILVSAISFGGIQNGNLDQPFTFSIPKARKATQLRLVSCLVHVNGRRLPGFDPPWRISITEIPVSQSPEGLVTARVRGNTDLGIIRLHTIAVSFHIRYAYEPTPDAIKTWEAERVKWQSDVLAPWLDKQFEIRKAMMQRRAKVATRPSDDLRREERFEIMQIVVREFLKLSDTSGPTSVEAEGFHRYFDIESMFCFAHPSWWKPRNVKRTDYDITDDMPASRFGSSLGWLLQIDGDQARNEFLNSPFVRVCIPINDGLEREAVAWLASHVEGWLGLGDGGGELNTLVEALLDDLEKMTLAKRHWRDASPSEVMSAMTTISPDQDVRPWFSRVEVVREARAEGGRKLVWKKPKRPADEETSDGSAIIPLSSIFPAFNEYSTTVPVDGFVYETLDVQT